MIGITTGANGEVLLMTTVRNGKNYIGEPFGLTVMVSNEKEREEAKEYLKEASLEGKKFDLEAIDFKISEDEESVTGEWIWIGLGSMIRKLMKKDGLGLANVFR